MGFCHAEAIGYFARYTKPLATKAMITDTNSISTLVIESDNENITKRKLTTISSHYSDIKKEANICLGSPLWDGG